MSSFSRLLRPLRQAASAFFTCDLSLQRGQQGVQLVLQQRRPAGSGPQPPSHQELARRKQMAEFDLMLEQLQALLNDLPENRRTLRHLVFVEQALAKKGWRALHKLPLDVLQRALEQIEGLVTNWSPVGLATLRSKMAVALIERERGVVHAESEAYRTAAVLDADADEASLPEVQDCSEEDALAAAYAALGPLAPASAPAEVQGEPGSPSARAPAPPLPCAGAPGAAIRLHELQE